MEALSRIQKELKAPKSQNNNFGNYKYRSCEDILEAVKKLLEDGETITLTDTIEQIGERYYIKATARFMSEKECVESVSYAREPLSKKGMDESQITGAASSYARKYALNGLFAIDDTKDADAEDNRDTSDKKQRSENLAIVCTEYNKCEDMIELHTALDMYADTVEKMSEWEREIADQTYTSVENLIKKNLPRTPIKHDFASTETAWEWFQEKGKALAKLQFKDVDQIDAWEKNNQPYIAGLSKLSAAKYKKDDKSPKERIEAQIEKLRNDLKQPIAEAAE